MKFTCNQRILSQGISSVQKAISSRSPLPILKGIYIEIDEDELRLVGNDLELGIEANIKDVEIKKEGSCVVDARLFGEIIRKLPDSPVEIDVDDQFNIHIKCENSKFNLRGYSPDEYPKLPSVEEDYFYDLPEDLLKNMIKQTVFSISQDENRTILTGELMEIEDGKISLVALDGYRLAIRSGYVNTDLGNRKVVIPGKALVEISRLIEEEEENIKISFTDKHALFVFKELKVITRLLEGEFMNYKQIIPKEENLRIQLNTKEFLKSIERASLMAREGKNNLVKFQIEKDSLHISSNSEMGEVDEVIKIDAEGESIEIAFNSRYLIDALKVIDSEEIYMHFISPVSPCLIIPCDGTMYTYLLLPVRISAS